jgi:heme exporter protein D
MTEALPHFGFIAAAYGATVAVFAGLIAWVVIDARLQRRALADVEAARGVRRKAQTP